ncbi:MAG: RnfABCDGE type electron transport complex subunit D [Ruminiclostridium sp.]|nr:RnfABCDGE type electron transport complex subunit D [Ruminiclostridium sp.]
MSDNTNELLDKFDSDVKTYETTAVRRQRKSKSIYGDQLICLTALLGMSVWQNGYRSLIISIGSVLICVLADMVFCRMTHKTYNPRDLSTIASGLCIALMMPASVHYGIVAGGALLAIAVKHIFGGKDNYIFNPTCVAVAFLIICYPNDMLLYPAVGSKPALWGDVGVPLVSGVESYLLKLGTAPDVSLENLMLGNVAGPMGSTQFLIIAVCGVCLMMRRSLSPLVTLCGLGSYCALTALFPVFSSIGDTMLMELSGGYLLFGLVFLAADPQTVPKTAKGKILYGLIIGVVGCLFRHFGKVEGSFLFVVLIANALSLHLDEMCEAAASAVKRSFAYMKGSMGKYEKLRSEAENESRPKLTDTMEIIVPPTNYNMPPIDNKVIKINRKKPNIITRYADNMRIKRRRDELVRKKQIRDGENNYMNAMRMMIGRHRKEAAPKTEEKKSLIPHIIKQPQKKSQQKNNKQGQ